MDLGPDGGDKRGEIVVSGTPKTVAEYPTSHTGRYLKQVLKQNPPDVVAVWGWCWRGREGLGVAWVVATGGAGSWRLFGGLRYAWNSYEVRGQDTRSQPMMKK